MRYPSTIIPALAVAAAAALFSPTLAFADSIDTPTKVVNLICQLSGWLYSALLALAVIFIIYAAFLFLTAGDDAEKVGKARKQLIYAVVAVAVAILATGIIKLTQELLGTPTGVC